MLSHKSKYPSFHDCLKTYDHHTWSEILTEDPKKMKPEREMAARRALNRSSTSRSLTARSTPLPVGTTVNAFTVTCAHIMAAQGDPDMA